MRDGDVASNFFIAKFTGREAAQCHSVVGILSYVMDYAYFDTDDEITKALMRLHIVKPLYHALTAQGVKSKILYGAAVLFDNTQLPPYVSDAEAQEELDDMDWSDEEPIEWNLFNDRTFLQSLIKNDALVVMERGDIFVLRADAAFLKSKEGNCALCRYFKQEEDGTSICGADFQATSPDAKIGKVCTNFSPKPKVEKKPSDRYVLIDETMIHVPDFTVNAAFVDGELAIGNDIMAELRKELEAKGERMD